MISCRIVPPLKGGGAAGVATLGAAGVEVAQSVLAETQSAVLPLVPYLDTLRWVFIAVALVGIAVTIYARLDDWKRGSDDRHHSRRDHRHPMDVVSEGLVVSGDQTFDPFDAEILQHLDPDMPIQQHVGVFLTRGSRDDRRFDQANLFDGRGDLAILAAGFDGCAEGAHRQDGFYWHSDAIALKSERHRVGRFTLAPAHSPAPTSSDCPR